mmetsp:Transcript_31521/g.28716  ORF Transcript_31521/g.28716 Transcript_31521/m.28716 type:complete len:109 (+) Transcript_31521:1122-1448(+)
MRKKTPQNLDDWEKSLLNVNDFKFDFGKVDFKPPPEPKHFSRKPDLDLLYSSERIEKLAKIIEQGKMKTDDSILTHGSQTDRYSEVKREAGKLYRQFNSPEPEGKEKP